MKVDSMINVGVLGCGPIAQFAHLEACRKAQNAKLFAVCDQAQDLADKMGGYYEAPKIYYDFEDMLHDEAIDVIIIATADEFHLSTSMKAVLAGKHVLVEKPLGADLEVAYELKKAIGMTGCMLQVGHMKRYDPGVRFAKDFIQSEVGDIIAYKAWYCDSTHRYDMTDSTQPVPFYSQNSIRPDTNPKSDPERYYMMAHGSHLVDLARFLNGPIISVQAHLNVKNHLYCWFVDVEFENGSNGHLDLTVAVRMDWHEGFELYGTTGSVMGKLFNPWYFKSSQVRCFSEKAGQYVERLDNKAHFFQLQLEGFAGSLLNGDEQIGTNIDDGIESIKAMIAISESVRTGQRVRLNSIPHRF